MKIMQFDGGAVSTPSTSGIGIILLEDNHVLKEISRKLDGIGTNNEAEYSALIEGLKQALTLGLTEILVQGDSRLVVNLVAGSWKVNKDTCIRGILASIVLSAKGRALYITPIILYMIQYKITVYVEHICVIIIAFIMKV